MKRTKAQLKAELLAVLEDTLAALERAHADARAGATHEEAKPENDKDTRALEQSYLARGQAMRIEALKAGLASLSVMALTPTDSAKAGALVEAEDDDGEALAYFVAPEGGGTRLQGGVLVVTPLSPVGAALIGKREGDEVELRVAGKARQLTIRRVS
ncbi:MAG: GreA/GreB family elongation factor [Myxococcus sp.]|nr:GreA/GreB family elongation factor [Myxococcus sp.]